MRFRPAALLVAALLVLPVAPTRAAAPFAFARRALGTLAAPVERTYAVPAGAVLAGVTWAGGDATVSVRRGLGAWEELDNDAGEAGGRPGTEPFFLGRGGAPVTFRIVPDGAVSDARVDFVGGGEARTTNAAATRSLPRLGAVVTRAGWGADESLRRGGVSHATPQALVVHHTVTGNDYTQAEAASYVRAVYAYHTRSRGWSDLGYNLIVDRFGTVYEGRHGDFARGVVGAHTAGFNTGTLGISLLGNYDAVDTPAPMVAALTRAGTWGAERWGFDPRGRVTLTSQGSPRFRAGTRVTVYRMPGHRDLGTTACPGRYAYDRLAQVRTEAWRAFRARIGTPVVKGAPVRAPEPVRIRASIDKTAYWRATIRDSNGTALVTTTGRGRSIFVSWDGVMPNGLPAVPGTSFTFTLAADDRVHGPSDPAVGTFEAGLPTLL
jgi:uncharacterized protein with LGFP repeats